MAEWAQITIAFGFTALAFGIGFICGATSMSKHIRSENHVRPKEADQ